jgi:threonine dehydrogenase-like Zn-dependent dehydrogenase
MKAAQVSRPGGDFQIVDRPVPQPGLNEVLVQVEACGVCHGDALVKEGGFPGLTYPRVPVTTRPLNNLTNPATPYTREALGEAGRPAVSACATCCWAPDEDQQVGF